MSDLPLSHHGAPPRSLATKIIALVFAASAATSVIITGNAIRSAYRDLTVRLAKSYPRSVGAAAEALEAGLTGAGIELDALSHERFGRFADRVAPRLEQALGKSDHFWQIELLDAEGTPIAAAGPSPPLSGPVRRQLARESDAAPRLLPAEPSADALLMSVAVDVGERGHGTLVGRLREEALRAPLVAERPDPLARLALVDAGGRVAVDADAEGRRRGEVLSGSELLASSPGVLQRYLDGDTRMLGTARSIAPHGWSVVLEIPLQHAYAPVIAVVTRLLVVGVLAVLLFSLLAYKLTGAIVGPIEKLSEGARRVADGDLDHEIPEPPSRDEIGLLTHTFNEMIRRLRGYQAQIERANRDLTERNSELQHAKEAFEQLSITDGLTKLHNHRFFQENLTREIKRAHRAQEPLSMLLIDIDDFKQLNDRIGHAAGDELLMGIARILTETVRDSDLLARYGGEEFVVLAADTDLEGAERLAEKVRMAIAEHPFILDDSLRPNRVTVSVGVAQYNGNRKTFFRATDRALYRAKAEGKNCVCIDSDPPVL